MTTCSAISRPTRSCASDVDAPRCGVSTTLGAARSGLSEAIGSTEYTSTAAPARWPECSASARAASSTIPPRATLRTIAPGFVASSWALPMSPRVCDVSGVWTVMTSARCRSSVMPTRRAPASDACSSVRYGSLARTRISQPTARRATALPIFPSPTMPSVLPRSSVPVKRERSHSPALTDASASGTWRTRASSRAIVCSAAAMVLPVGELTIITPARVAASTSIRSIPTLATPDHAQARRGRGEQLGVDPGLRAHDQRVPSAALSQQVQQLVAGDVRGGRRCRARSRGDRRQAAPPTRRRGCVTWLAPSLGAARARGSASQVPRRQGIGLPVECPVGHAGIRDLRHGGVPQPMIRRHLMALRFGLMVADGLIAVGVFMAVAELRFRNDGNVASLWRALNVEPILRGRHLRGRLGGGALDLRPLPPRRALERVDGDSRPGARDAAGRGDHASRPSSS